MLTTAAKDSATILGLHACTEAELLFACAFGRLVGALHVLKVLDFLKESGRREWGFRHRVSMDVFDSCIFLGIRIARQWDSSYFLTFILEGPVVFLDETLGVIAQLVERLHGMEEVWGSTPHGSTKCSFCLDEKNGVGFFPADERRIASHPLILHYRPFINSSHVTLKAARSLAATSMVGV